MAKDIMGNIIVEGSTMRIKREWNWSARNSDAIVIDTNGDTLKRCTNTAQAHAFITLTERQNRAFA